MKMITSFRRVLTFISALALICSCTDYSKIVFSDFKVTSIDSLRYSLTDVNAIVNSKLTVDNPYFAMTLKDFAADVVTPEGKTIVEVRLPEEMLLDIAAKDRTELQAPLRVHIRNALKLLSLGIDGIQAMSDEGYVVNYSMAVSKGRKFYNINKHDVPLETFLKQGQ